MDIYLITTRQRLVLRVTKVFIYDNVFYMICSSRARFYKTLTLRVTSLQTADCDCQIDVEEREVQYILLEYRITVLE